MLSKISTIITSQVYESLGIISNELSSLKNSLLITTGARKRIFTNQLLSDTTLTFKSITVNILTDLVFLIFHKKSKP